MSWRPNVGRQGRILDFDIENRPLSYWLPDRPTAEITSIASMWSGDPDSMQVLLLGSLCQHPGCTKEYHHGMSAEDMLTTFYERYLQADIVTGHYIRKHDLPIINGALMEHGLPTLPARMSIDTKLDMLKKADIPATQEFLLEMLDVRDTYGKPFRKFHMTQSDWREANRLTPAGLTKTTDRVSSDVYAHDALRKRMQELGMLRAPSLWKPGGAGGNTPGHGGTGG